MRELSNPDGASEELQAKSMPCRRGERITFPFLLQMSLSGPITSFRMRTKTDRFQVKPDIEWQA
jgi:hypothetical protein